MSLWSWIAFAAAAYGLLGPFVSGMHVAVTRGMGVWAGLVFGGRRFHRKATGMTLLFLPVFLCLAIVVGSSALLAFLAQWPTGRTGWAIFGGLVGFVAGTAIALRKANRIAGFIIDWAPNKDDLPCPVCYRYRIEGDAVPCPECGEPAPPLRCDVCECKLEPGEIGPCPECREVPQ